MKSIWKNGKDMAKKTLIVELVLMVAVIMILSQLKKRKKLTFEGKDLSPYVETVVEAEKIAELRSEITPG